MAIKIKNIDSTSHNWGGKLYTAGETYETTGETDARRYGEDDTFIVDYADDKAEVYDGNTLITSKAVAIYFLQNYKILSPVDEQNKPYVNLSMTNIDWYYSPHSLDFYTSKYNSLYNRKHDGAGIDDGTDAGDAWLQFYDEDDNEILKDVYESDGEYQSRLTSDCVKTVLNWEKQESFDVVGAFLYIEDNPADRAYLWVVAAPDIPYEYGGSKPFMGRGMNLKMMAAKRDHYFDAKTSKTVHYDPVFHSGKVATVVKHAAGVQIGIQLIYICYEE